MNIPKIKVLERDEYSIITRISIDGKEHTEVDFECSTRQIIFHKNIVVKLNDVHDLNQNYYEYKRWEKMQKHPDFKQEKRYFAEVLYVSPDYEILIQRRYKFKEVALNLRKTLVGLVFDLAEKYDLGTDYCLYTNWGISDKGIIKIYDFGA